MEWIVKIGELVKLPTKYFALVSIATGALCFLPKSVLSRLYLESVPSPLGTLVGIAFLMSTGLVALNVTTGLGNWIDYQHRTMKRRTAMERTLCELDPAEQSVLRKFFLGSQSTITMPLDKPVVAGLIACGILQQVGVFGWQSFHGMLFSFRISDLARELIEVEHLGPSEFQIPNEGDRGMLNDGGNGSPRTVPGSRLHVDGDTGKKSEQSPRRTRRSGRYRMACHPAAAR